MVSFLEGIPKAVYSRKRVKFGFSYERVDSNARRLRTPMLFEWPWRPSCEQVLLRVMSFDGFLQGSKSTVDNGTLHWKFERVMSCFGC